MAFIHEAFLLSNEAARRLYHEYAASEPILDYHCHLPPRDVAENRQFGDLYEIWLEGDHYKWRAMRANGVEERYCSGDAPPREKFLAWAQTVPSTLRNPLYHWTHLELKRYFGIDELLDGRSALRIWDQAKASEHRHPEECSGLSARERLSALEQVADVTGPDRVSHTFDLRCCLPDVGPGDRKITVKFPGGSADRLG